MGKRDKKPGRAVSPTTEEKKPRGGSYAPQNGKNPRGGSLADAVETKNFSWRSGEVDMDGDWGWNASNVKYLLFEIIPRLHSLETMTWQEVRASGSHPIPADQVCGDARARLSEIGKGDEETLYSVRVTGRCRLWGLRRGAIFHLLWFDPEHSVYRVEKKNT